MQDSYYNKGIQCNKHDIYSNISIGDNMAYWKFYFKCSFIKLQYLPIVTVCFTGGWPSEASNQSKSWKLITRAIQIAGAIRNTGHRECRWYCTGAVMHAPAGLATWPGKPIKCSIELFLNILFEPSPQASGKSDKRGAPGRACTIVTIGRYCSL